MNGYLKWNLKKMELLRVGKLCLIFIVFLYSCKGKENNDNVIHKNLVEYKNTYFATYEDVYNNAVDSIMQWRKDSLSVTMPIFFSNAWALDSVIVFNNDTTRMFSTINTQDVKNKDAEYDYMLDFGGAKIDEKWYFFFLNVSEPVVRGYWQDSVYSPLSFEELSYIAHVRRFKGIIKKNEDGSFKSNESFFWDTFFDVHACKGKEDVRKCADSLVIEVTKNKFKYKLTPEEIVEIQQIMEKSVKPPEPESSFWDEFFKKRKRFD